MLLDSNAEFELVRLHEQPKHVVHEYLVDHNPTEYPAAVFVSPDGPSLAFPMEPKSSSRSIEVIVSSPKRDRFLVAATQFLVSAIHCV